LATLKQFEEALRAQGMNMALAILEKMRKEEKKTRSVAPARRVSGRKMTPELARKILELHSTTDMTQQEIAFQLGINQGRVNEVIKRGKWLTEDPQSEEAQARDKAKARMKRMQSEDTPIPRKQPIATRADEGAVVDRRLSQDLERLNGILYQRDPAPLITISSRRGRSVWCISSTPFLYASWWADLVKTELVTTTA
jgi:hypothetical protein